MMLTGPLALAALVVATQPSSSADCRALASADGQTKYELIDANGKTHKASVVRIEGSTVVVRSGGQTFVIPCAELERHERPADRRWDGALIGFGAGVGMAAWVGVGTAGASLLNDNPDAQYHEPKAAEIGIIAASTAIGYLIDGLHGARHTVIVGKMPAVPVRSSGLNLAVTGHPGQRQLDVGYRVTF